MFFIHIREENEKRDISGRIDPGYEKFGGQDIPDLPHRRRPWTLLLAANVQTWVSCDSFYLLGVSIKMSKSNRILEVYEAFKTHDCAGVPSRHFSTFMFLPTVPAFDVGTDRRTDGF